jgi:hypothetical protein
MMLAWIRALLAGRPPFLLSWRVRDEEHHQIYGAFLDAVLAAAETLGSCQVETMSLSDREGRPVPFPAYAVLTWRWGSEEYMAVVRDRREAAARLTSLAEHSALEFVSLSGPDGRTLLTAEAFRRMRARNQRPIRGEGKGQKRRTGKQRNVV